MLKCLTLPDTNGMKKGKNYTLQIHRNVLKDLRIVKQTFLIPEDAKEDS